MNIYILVVGSGLVNAGVSFLEVRRHQCSWLLIGWVLPRVDASTQIDPPTPVSPFVKVAETVLLASLRVIRHPA